MNNHEPGVLGSVRKLMECLRQQKVQPGQKLMTEPRLAQETGISRSQLREALAVLQAWGMLDRKQGGSTVFCEPDFATLAERIATLTSPTMKKPGASQDFLVVRASLTLASAAQAALNRTSGELAALLEAADFVYKSTGNADQWFCAEQAFHQAVWEASHNAFTIMSGKMLAPYVPSSLVGRSACKGVKAKETVGLYGSIFQAIWHQDAEGAQKMALQHFQSVDQHKQQ